MLCALSEKRSMWERGKKMGIEGRENEGRKKERAV
jgi:hypothetical protein